MTTGPAPALAYSTANCQVASTLEVIGETGTMLVLREVFNGVRRFDDMRRHSGLSRQVLSNRLATLVDHGILRREPYQEEGTRVRHEYRLTPKGFDLYPVLAALAQWGERYLADADGVPVEFEHRGCGAVARSVLVCEAGHRIDEPREVATRPGPGARPFEG
jgi:DNA-binding HxlR family transcriptional regulator